MIDEQDRPVTIRKACQIVFNGEIGPDGFRSRAESGVTVTRPTIATTEAAGIERPRGETDGR